jgi:hypothetical protein
MLIAVKLQPHQGSQIRTVSLRRWDTRAKVPQSGTQFGFTAVRDFHRREQAHIAPCEQVATR